MISSDKSRASGRGIVTNGEGKAFSGHLNLTRSMAEVWAKRSDHAKKANAASNAASLNKRRKQFVEQHQKREPSRVNSAGKITYAGYDGKR